MLEKLVVCGVEGGGGQTMLALLVGRRVVWSGQWDWAVGQGSGSGQRVKDLVRQVSRGSGRVSGLGIRSGLGLGIEFGEL